MIPLAEITNARTLRERLLVILKRYSPRNTSELSREAEADRTNVRLKLATAEREGHVKSAIRRKFIPNSGPIMVHDYWITEAGEAWLKKQGIA